MTDSSTALRRLAERVLGKGADLPLGLLLEHLVPVARLRALARRFGLSPKGGFRIEKAPARVLAPLLAEVREPDRLDDVLQLLLPPDPQPKPAADRDDGQDADAAAAEASPMLALRETEPARLRDELERAREAGARARERDAEAGRRIEQLERDLAVQRRDLERQRSIAERATPRGRGDTEAELRRRVRDLEDEREGFVATDEALRRQLAVTQSRLRHAEQAVGELEELVPKGRRKQKQPPPPTEERRFRLPWFLPSFYKSLVGKDRKAVERAFQAVLLFCTEGHSYPGLEVKQMGGQETWSLRASLGLRVYFRSLPDGDVEFLELADREDQHTTLRRLKERS
jgi:hypothetical protein